MAWFKKKNKEEDFDDELDDDEEEERPKKPLRRKLRSSDFKDLNPNDRKRRKEPPKPWGKKERLTILSLIILTSGISGYLALAARDYKLPGMPRITLPAFTLPGFLSGETIILDGKRDVESDSQVNLATLEFKEKTRQLTGIYGLYVARLNDGTSYGINQSEVFQAASLVKLPVMAGLYLEKEAGRLNLNTKYALKNSDKLGGSGSLQSKPAGYEISYKNLIKLMGQESDNTAFNIARKHLGEEKIKEIINELGMNSTNLENNETTPEDIGRFFEALWNGTLLSEDNKEELLAFLTDTIYEDWLPAGVPSNVKVAHKYGRENHVLNDAGIVFAENPYVIVILSKAISDNEVNKAFRELSRTIYSFESAYEVSSREQKE